MTPPNPLLPEVLLGTQISDLAFLPFDAAEFPFAFLGAFGNKDTTLRRLRAGNNNAKALRWWGRVALMR